MLIPTLLCMFVCLKSSASHFKRKMLINDANWHKPVDPILCWNVLHKLASMGLCQYGDLAKVYVTCTAVVFDNMPIWVYKTIYCFWNASLVHCLIFGLDWVICSLIGCFKHLWLNILLKFAKRCEGIIGFPMRESRIYYLLALLNIPSHDITSKKCRKKPRDLYCIFIVKEDQIVISLHKCSWTCITPN